MAHLRTLWPIRTDFDLGYNHQRDDRSARGWPPRASRNRFDNAPINAQCEHEHEEGGQTRSRDQFQSDWYPRGERRQSNGPRLYESGYASTSYLDETGNRFNHPAPHPQARPYQGPDSVSILGLNRPKAASSSFDRQQNQRHFSHPLPLSLPPNRKIRQRKSPRIVHDDNSELLYHLPPPSPTDTERFAQGRSNWSSASIQPRDYSNAPTDHPRTGSTSHHSAHKLCGLTRRPRVQGPPKRISRMSGDASTVSVDPETSQVTEMGYSVMSVRHSDPDGSGSSFRTRFALPPTSTRPIPIGRSGGEAHPLGASPLLHVEHETERPISRIKAREGAGSAFANTHSIPKKEPNTLVTPSLMNHVEGEWLSLSSISSPKTPPLDQHSVIPEDLQQEVKRPIAGCRTDPRVSSVAVGDRDSLDFVHSTSPSLEVSHAQSHAVPGNNYDGRNQPEEQPLFQELYQMLESPTHPGSDTLRSTVETRRDGTSWEGSVRPGCAFEEEPNADSPRGTERPEQALHVDVLLAQRVVRDAMQEDGECEEFRYQSCMLSASECGEEAVDSSSDWSECGLDRKHSTRSVFDWGYA